MPSIIGGGNPGLFSTGIKYFFRRLLVHGSFEGYAKRASLCGFTKAIYHESYTHVREFCFASERT